MSATAVPPRRVDLLATGGTIASREGATRGAVATDRADDLLGRVAVPPGVTVTSRDVLRMNSFAMTPVDMQVVLDAVLGSAASPAVDGVVVTHGTDTMEETAFLVDLFVSGDTPVVFTGAQRSADFADSDGPGNLGDAVAVAAAGVARGIGAVIVFDGLIFPARGTRKAHTSARAAFSCPNAGPLGGLVAGEPKMFARPRRMPPLNRAAFRADGVRVDIVAVYPGCDAVALDAAAAAGAQGVVLEATGSGNANLAICDAVDRLTKQGVVVLLSTRVQAGPVVALYGGGGGSDLVAAGALPTGHLGPSQARMLLIALLGTTPHPPDVRAALTAQL